MRDFFEALGELFKWALVFWIFIAFVAACLAPIWALMLAAYLVGIR